MGEAGNARIAETYLLDAARRGIALVGGLDVAFEQRAHARQALGEFAGDLKCGLREIRVALRRRELQLAFHLMKEHAQHRVELVTDEVVDSLLG